MRERLQTQVQNPASGRGSPEPQLSPDRFQLVNLVLHGAPVSEPIRDVYKCYQHLHIITYSSTSAPNINANARGCFLFSCGAAVFQSLCPFAPWLMERRKTHRLKNWNISGLYTGQSFVLVSLFKSGSFGGKKGDCTEDSNTIIAKGFHGTNSTLCGILSWGHLLPGCLGTSRCLSSTQRPHI